MKRAFSSKEKRKQAEDDIIRNLRLIRKRLEDYRKKGSEPVNREKIMQTLTEFLRIKRQSKIH
jgi:hypothetical protein